MSENKYQSSKFPRSSTRSSLDLFVLKKQRKGPQAIRPTFFVSLYPSGSTVKEISKLQLTGKLRHHPPLTWPGSVLWNKGIYIHIGLQVVCSKIQQQQRQQQ